MMTMSSLHQKLRTGGSGSSSTSANGSGGVGPGWCALNEGGGPANCTPGGAENAYHLSHFIILPVKMPSFYQDRLGTNIGKEHSTKRVALSAGKVIDDEFAHHARHGYYAAVSFADSLLGTCQDKLQTGGK
jgi:hypothetical protein